jgi:hypothetical protein
MIVVFKSYLSHFSIPLILKQLIIIYLFIIKKDRGSFIRERENDSFIVSFIDTSEKEMLSLLIVDVNSLAVLC